MSEHGGGNDLLQALKKHFALYGAIESVRFRSLVRCVV